ncbi:Hsp20/alpha crystallin family protein [Mammaliicoccus sciuri]|uniref:Hsp20/alpha crystallin family protein n=1 Tax=Mammaliicoccus sciuri TaxID=1296 RepID=UPI000D1D6B81|nr:Hsp20/alpha crystallin family protein [Mammaliicoccus sciuri]PTJ98955.1 hypothetical protein BUZ87_14440 [Mammaliicoccus sciuri]RIN83232.1 Hsp20/alpha crystallin family protein [Mammaliicoccus sciuri]
MSNLTPFNKNIFDFSPSRIFDDHFNSLFKYFNTAIPKSDLRETNSEYIVDIDLPGINKENINLTYEDNTLYLSAIQSNENEQKDNNGNTVFTERSKSQISRYYHLPNGDEDNIKADFENGVLHVSVPKLNSINKKSKIIDIQ